MLQHAVGDSAGEAGVGEGQGLAIGDAEAGVDMAAGCLLGVGQQRVDAVDLLAGQGDLDKGAIAAADVYNRLRQIGSELGEEACLDGANHHAVDGQREQVWAQIVCHSAEC